MPGDKDWRLQAYRDIPAHQVEGHGLGELASDAMLSLYTCDNVRLETGDLLAIPIPNATAMMVNASRRAFCNAQRLFSVDSMRGDRQGAVTFGSNADAIDFLEEMVAAVFTAYAALECFANECIPPWYKRKKEPKKQGDPEKILNKEEVERVEKLGIKLAEVLPEIFRIASPKGTKIWQSFVELEKVRNRVVHLKYADRGSADEHAETIWKALVLIESPHVVAMRMIDHFLLTVEHSPILEFDDFKPTRHRWHVHYSSFTDSR